MLLSNHNNALMDALLIATRAGRFSYFLTRASVFKKPKVKAFLKTLNMLPVYRVRDGWSSVQNNNDIFNYCRELLQKGKVVSLFPEGNHNIKRSIRPLSKGFTRIVFETLKTYPDINLSIVPVGINYEKADAFADSVLMNIGEPIAANTFYSDDRNADVINLKETISSKLKELTGHISSEHYDDILANLELHHADFLNPKAVNSCITSDFQDCKFRKPKKPMFLKRFFKSVMILTLIGPYVIWKKLVQPKIKEVEFVSTFRFALAITLVPFWIVLITLLLGWSIGWMIALYYALFTLGISLLAVKI